MLEVALLWRGVSRSVKHRDRALLPLVSAAVLALAGCQSSSAPEGVVHVSPAAVGVAPGGQVQFSVRSPWGTDATWSLSPPSCGTISPSALFTASMNPSEASGICTVVATLRSDPTKIGLAVVTVEIAPQVNMVAASGQRQSADGVEVESVVLEPVTSVTSVDSTGTVESRSGFYPSGSTSNP